MLTLSEAVHPFEVVKKVAVVPQRGRYVLSSLKFAALVYWNVLPAELLSDAGGIRGRNLRTGRLSMGFGGSSQDQAESRYQKGHKEEVFQRCFHRRFNFVGKPTCPFPSRQAPSLTGIGH